MKKFCFGVDGSIIKNFNQYTCYYMLLCEISYNILLLLCYSYNVLLNEISYNSIKYYVYCLLFQAIYIYLFCDLMYRIWQR